MLNRKAIMIHLTLGLMKKISLCKINTNDNYMFIVKAK